MSKDTNDKPSLLKQAVEMAKNKAALTKEQATRAKKEFSENAGQAAKFAEEKYEEFKETRAGKATTVLSGKFGTRVGAIVTASVALAAASGPAAIVPLAFGLGAVAVGVVADFMDVRNTRLLKKENDMLAKFVDSRLKEKEVLDKNPELSKILGDRLLPHQDKAHEGKTLNDKFSKATDVTGRIADNFGTIGTVATYIAKFEFKNAAVAAVKSITAFVTGKDRREAVNDVRKVLENQIEVLRKNDLTPAYKDATELKETLRKQRIQQMALTALSKDPDYKKIIKLASDPNNPDQAKYKEQVEKRFESLKKQIESMEKAVSERTWQKEAWSVWKDFRRSLDPHSQYYEQSTVKFYAVVLETNRATGAQSHELKEFKGKEFREHKVEQQHKEEERATTQQDFNVAAKAAISATDETIAKAADEGTEKATKKAVKEIKAAETKVTVIHTEVRQSTVHNPARDKANEKARGAIREAEDIKVVAEAKKAVAKKLSKTQSHTTPIAPQDKSKRHSIG